ncbi:MAG: hypothetical protein AB1806_16320 [Acidobacteriota bacterium]
MANRIGIELVPSLCRVVVLEGRAGLFRRRSGRPGRIKAFHEVPYHASSPGQLEGELRRLGVRGPAGVAIWGLRGVHHVLSLPPADPSDLEAMARREAGSPGTGGDSGLMADGIMLGDAVDGGRRQVTYVSVPADEVRASIGPLTEAGIDVDGVVTPALAHALLARQRLGVLSGTTVAILAINGRVTGLTVVRGGAVLFARELPWGHETERAIPEGASADAGGFIARVASELRRSVVYLKQHHQADVSQVLVCGDMPDLRALTGPLMHELNLDVETLDSPDGLDITQLPEPADALRSRLGAVRTAWALAAGGAPTVNLLPREGTTVRRRLTTERQTHLWRAAIAGVVIAVLAWGVVELLTRNTRDRTDSLRRQIATLEPEVQRLDEVRLARATNAARAAALEAFASEGPRLARVLEALGRAAPPEVAITSLKVSPGVGAWNVSVTGQALAPTPAEAQAAFNRFAKAVNGDEYLGDPSQAPEIKVHIEEPEPEPEPVSREAAVAEAPRLEPAYQDRRTAVQRPREQWMARDGRLYRIVVPPLPPEELDESRRQRAGARPGTAERASQPPKYVGAVLDFTLKYEVRK